MASISSRREGGCKCNYISAKYVKQKMRKKKKMLLVSMKEQKGDRRDPWEARNNILYTTCARHSFCKFLTLLAACFFVIDFLLPYISAGVIL